MSTDERVSIAARDEMIDGVMTMLNHGNAQVVETAAAVSILLAVVGVESGSIAYTVDLCMDHECGAALAQQIIPYANQSGTEKNTPNETWAAFLFLRTVFEKKRFDWLYTTDLKVLLTVIIRMLENTHPSDPLMP